MSDETPYVSGEPTDGPRDMPAHFTFRNEPFKVAPVQVYVTNQVKRSTADVVLGRLRDILIIFWALVVPLVMVFAFSWVVSQVRGNSTDSPNTVVTTQTAEPDGCTFDGEDFC